MEVHLLCMLTDIGLGPGFPFNMVRSTPPSFGATIIDFYFTVRASHSASCLRLCDLSFDYTFFIILAPQPSTNTFVAPLLSTLNWNRMAILKRILLIKKPSK